MIRKVLISGLAGIILTGCATTEKARKNVEQPVKTPEKVTEEYHNDMATLRGGALKEGAIYEAEFKRELERVKQGKMESYKKVIELYGKLEEKRKKAYEADMERLRKEEEAIKKAYDEANEAFKKEKEGIAQ